MIELPGGGEVVGVGDSLTMATSVEKYSHSRASGGSRVPADILHRASGKTEKKEKAGRSETKETHKSIKTNK